MKYLGINEITTSRQKANGTRAFETPFKIRRKPVRFYSSEEAMFVLTEIATQCTK